MSGFDINDIERRMDGAIDALKKEFAGLRTGRASASLLDPIKVEAYGALTPINQVGNGVGAGAAHDHDFRSGTSTPWPALWKRRSATLHWV
jgi:hypothetical protein